MANHNSLAPRRPLKPFAAALAAVLAAVITAVALTAVASVPAAGQAVHGRVLDESTALPVAGAGVVLRSEAAVFRAVTGEAGEFRVRAERAGRYTLEVSHPDYVDVRTLDVSLAAGADREVVVRLRRGVVTGDTLVVEADVRADASFEGAMARHRSLPGYGYRRVITHQDPELRNAMKLQDALRWLPDGSCTILLHNGFHARDDADMWMELPADAVEAVEFYRRAQQAPRGLREIAARAEPVDYMRGCTIVALWSRRTPTETRQPLLKLLGAAAASVLLVVLLR